MTNLSAKWKSLCVYFRTRLRKVQRAPEPQRKRWLVLSSSLAIVAVVGLWVLYLNYTVPYPEGWNEGKTAVAAEETTEEENGNSVGKTLGRGFSAIFDQFLDKWNEAKGEMGKAFESAKEVLEKGNQLTLEATPPPAGGTPSSPELPEVAPALLPAAPERMSTSTL